MVVLDWKRLNAVNLSELQDEEADQLYAHLVEASVDDEADPEKLKVVFKVTQAVMQSKALQADVALDELEKMAEKEGTAGAKREQELLHEIDDLRQQVLQLQRFGSKDIKSQVGGSSQDLAQIHNELRTFQRDNERLKLELQDTENFLAKEKVETEKLLVRLEESDQEKRDLRHKVSNLTEEIQDYRHQMDSHRESTQHKQDRDLVSAEKLREKNRQINQLLSEIEILEKHNDVYQKDVTDLKAKLEDAVNQMELTTEEYLKLKNALQKSDSMVDNLQRDNQRLQANVEQLLEQNQQKVTAEERIMAALNKRIEDWKAAMQEKDDVIAELQSEATLMKEKLAAASGGADRASVTVLSKALEDRDKQIELLKNQLHNATEDIEQNTLLLEEMKHMDVRSPNHSIKSKSSHSSELQVAWKNAQAKALKLSKQLSDAEKHAQQKDKDLVSVLTRMQEYEQGEYGLAEAVGEIKDLRNNMKARDKQIEELTQAVNQSELFVSELLDENEELRSQLGLDPHRPLSADEVRRRYTARRQKERSLNFTLHQEIERLEEERIQLKQHVRNLSQMVGERAATLGLNAEDLQKIQEITVHIRDVRSMERENRDMVDGDLVLNSLHPSWEAEKETLYFKLKTTEEELHETRQQLQKTLLDMTKLRTAFKQASEQNGHLEKGMREILQSIREQNAKTDVVLECPSLDKLVKLIETKQLQGSYDSVALMKSELDRERGRNEQLTNDLKKSRTEALHATIQLEKVKLGKHGSSFENAEPSSDSLVTSLTMQLPENMPLASSETVATLNSQLAHVLKELKLKSETSVQLEHSLEECQKKLSAIRHQQGLVYKDYFQDKEAWEEEKLKWKEKHDAIEANEAVLSVKVDEFEKLRELLSHDDSEIRRRLAEMSGRMVILRTNEAVLSRKYKTLVELECSARKENNKLKKELISVEMSVTERVGYLQRHKDMMSFKVAALQKALDDCVPACELEATTRQLNALTAKYHEQLQKDNALTSRMEESSQFEVLVKQLHVDNNTLKQQLHIEKEKRHTLETILEELKYTGTEPHQEFSEQRNIQLSKQVAMLEMRELNEQQRADHAQRMYDHEQILAQQLKQRNNELEAKFRELTKINLEQQRVERELQDELSVCVSAATHEIGQTRIKVLEADETKLHIELSQLKETVEIARNQANALEMIRIEQIKELDSLRQQVLEFQASSDEKTIVGKLHRQLVSLQINDSVSERQVEKTQRRLAEVESRYLRLEQRCDEKEQSIYHIKNENRQKIHSLHKVIQLLRRQYSGAIPLAKQEKFSLTLITLQDEKLKVASELQRATEERRKAEDKLVEAELKSDSLEELLITLKDDAGSQKIVEWHKRLTDLRLKDMRETRKVIHLQEQVNCVTELFQKAEKRISELEEEVIKLEQENEHHQLDWEQKEIELEHRLQNHEDQYKNMINASSKFEDTVGQYPDNKLPIAKQLEQAVQTIRDNRRVIAEARDENRLLKKKLEQLHMKMKEQDVIVLARDKVISELRLQIPTSSERSLTAGQRFQSAQDYESRETLHVAKLTIENLQARVSQKEEALSRYQDLLHMAQEELMNKETHHQESMQILQTKLHQKNESTLNKFKEVVRQAVEKTSTPSLIKEQLLKVQQLEDTVAEQEVMIRSLADKLHDTRRERDSLRVKVEQVIKEAGKSAERISDTHKKKVEELESSLVLKEKKLQDIGKEMASLQAEVEEQKAVNVRAPSTTMQNAVEKLKQQLSTKEKQLQSLSKALADVKTDLVSTAQSNARAQMDENAQHASIQRQVERKTSELKETISSLEGQLSKLKKELQKAKDSEGAQTEQLDYIKRELADKDAVIEKFRLKKAESETCTKCKDGINAAKTADGDKTTMKATELKRQQSQPAEKPYDSEHEVKVQQEMVRWEAGKKWQQTVEKLKSKISLQTKELEEQQKKQTTLTNAVSRLEKEKISLELQLKDAKKSGVTNDVVEELRKKNAELVEEMVHLRHQVESKESVAFEELELRNQYLCEQLEEQERKFRQSNRKSSQHSHRIASIDVDTRRNSLQQQVIKLTSTKVNLESALEHSKEDVARLKSRIYQLEDSLDRFQQHEDNRRDPQTENMQIVEAQKQQIDHLESTIEKQRADKNALKALYGERFAELQSRNIELQNKIDLQQEEIERKPEMTTMQVDNFKKAAAKIAMESQHLTKQLAKERHTSEALRKRAAHLEADVSHMTQELTDAKFRAQNAEAKLPNFSAMDGREYKSFLTTQETIKTLKTDLHQKTNSVNKIQILLKEAMVRERQLLEEKGQMKLQLDSLLQEQELLQQELQNGKLQNLRYQTALERLAYQFNTSVPSI